MKGWTRMLVLAIAPIALAACDPAATQSAPVPPGEALNVSCADFAHTSAAALRATYGAENVVEQTLAGPEGETYPATVLFPHTPSRRLEIVWQDQAAKARPASISVSSENSAWIGPNGLSIGDELARVEQLNGRAFKLWGFSWDYGGWVSDWNGGALASLPGGCTVGVRFEATAEANDAQGDAEFPSDSQNVRAASPRVVGFAVVFPDLQ